MVHEKKKDDYIQIRTTSGFKKKVKKAAKKVMTSMSDYAEVALSDRMKSGI